jgi:hypothetical protein
MEDLRIGSLGFDDSPGDQTKDRSKKRSKPRHFEPQEELTDQVSLSSGSDTEEQPLGYSPPSPGEEPK